ncbi:family 43 glycosylhydrolase [Actinomycetes bacterium KLBMP 9797]
MSGTTLLIAVLAAVLATPAPAAAAAAPTAPYQTVITNATSAGKPVIRFDTAGNAVDAHDGDLAVFEGVYYLYGTSYDCGYHLRGAGTPFCGFKVYSSPDLVHWTDRGYLFDARTPPWQARCAPPRYGCYRPHVVYNATTERYVLWINGYDTPSGYHVFTATTPVGPFVEGEPPKLARQGSAPEFNNGDMDLFVGDDGTAYLAYSDIARGHAQVVEQLDTTYTTGTGQVVEVGVSGVEAPALFRRGSTYYHLHGSTCAYCSSDTRYKVARSPLGPWSAPALGGIPSASSCGGQPAFVATIPTTAGTTYLYGVDLWDNGARNQAVADYFWTPLAFTRAGTIEPLACPASVNLHLLVGAPGAQDPVPDLDQHAGVAGFRHWCDIASGWSRLQSFTPSRSGVLSGASITAYQRGATADLVVDLVAVDAQLRPTRTLHRTVVPRDTIGWSARQIQVGPNVAVTAGERYALVAGSATTAGCYGIAFSDQAPYPGGGSAYQDGAAGAWTAEPGRTLKFHTTVTAPPAPH